MLRIINGKIFDPVNGINGEIRDIHVREQKIVDGPLPPEAEVN
jgi:formylmethanofuran dehydrogenase subunit A